MSEQGDWMKDLADAANELGYSVVSVSSPHRIRLSGRGGIDVDIDSPFLSGIFLRTTLHPLPTHKAEDDFS